MVRATRILLSAALLCFGCGKDDGNDGTWVDGDRDDEDSDDDDDGDDDDDDDRMPNALTGGLEGGGSSSGGVENCAGPARMWSPTSRH